MKREVAGLKKLADERGREVLQQAIDIESICKQIAELLNRP